MGVVSGHRGAELHGFLSYLMRCVVAGEPCTVFGHGGKQVAPTGDHRWWISDPDGFRRDHPGWELTYDLERRLREIHDTNVEHWSAGVAGAAAVGEPV